MFNDIPTQDGKPETPKDSFNLLPPVWGKIPFEHVVINRKNLTPKLKTSIIEIMFARAMAQFQIIAGLSVTMALNKHISPSLALPCLMIGLAPSTYHFYNEANKFTLRLGRQILDISRSGAAPFDIADLPKILERYSHGIVDNNGNIILLMHPRSEFAKERSPAETAFLETLWNRKFQRTRFEIHEPRLKEKQPVFTFNQKRLVPQPA